MLLFIREVLREQLKEEKKKIKTVGKEDLPQGYVKQKELVLLYEELRTQAMNNAVHQASVGLSLFVRRGMLLWMTSRSMCINSSMDSKTNEEVSSMNPESENVNSDIVTILANVFLSLEQPGGGCYAA